MTADAEGNDLGAVGVPITGFAAVQLTGGPSFVSSAAGAATPLVLPAGYQKVGLFKVDGGPQDGGDAGDKIEFFQQGYKLSGDDQPTVQINLAQFDALVRKLLTGQTPDANGMVTIKALTPDTVFPLFVATKFKNGWSRRRNGLARISAVEIDKETRGEVNGRNTTFEWIDDQTVGGFYREWLVPPASGVAKQNWAVEVLGGPTGGTFTLLVNGIPTAPIAYGANAAAITSALNGISGVTGLAGITTSGTGPFTVAFPAAAVLTATDELTGGTDPSVAVS
ncbi:hypothetical protein [Microbacterium sp. PAMC21962]|uniref:hypothetical protein n=1 Tax=Microbacterium sp. PAMC21962 TaxID=2861280 RepID=UPI001C62BAC3|nr:hypothetical protein [Microbacterium sp. PAMC21962]QYF98908.1 hypothetical protein KY498_06760 [Microbacterium sp. PAMC21962]